MAGARACLPIKTSRTSATLAVTTVQALHAAHRSSPVWHRAAVQRRSRCSQPGWLAVTTVQALHAALCSTRQPCNAAAGAESLTGWQEWLEAFSWTEEERDPFIARRNACSPDCKALAREPMFVYETAAKCFYWSYYVYIYSEVLAQAHVHCPAGPGHHMCS